MMFVLFWCFCHPGTCCVVFGVIVCFVLHSGLPQSSPVLPGLTWCSLACSWYFSSLLWFSRSSLVSSGLPWSSPLFPALRSSPLFPGLPLYSLVFSGLSVVFGLPWSSSAFLLSKPCLALPSVVFRFLFCSSPAIPGSLDFCQFESLDGTSPCNSTEMGGVFDGSELGCPFGSFDKACFCLWNLGIWLAYG